MDTSRQTIYRIAFSLIRGNNLGLGRKMFDLLGDESRFFTLSDKELRSLLEVRTNIVSAAYRRELMEKAQDEAEFISRSGIKAIFFTDDDYPRRLLECDDAPVLLYVLGDNCLNSPKMLSIVGTRRCTAYGTDMTRRIVDSLADEYVKDIAIVSGLAYGIDVAAHKAALAADVPTIAVMGCPLNTIYPAEHRSIAIDIIRKGGALVSEYATSCSIHRANFLQRNRIVAGISDATLVVESDEKGGSIVTANIAAAYNRDVFAVPGRTTDRYSLGTNRLIATNKAAMARDADDIIDAMRWARRQREGFQATLTLELTPEQSSTLNYLREHPDFSVNELARGLNISFSTLTNVLFQLEMSDLIVAVPGNRYALTAAAAAY